MFKHMLVPTDGSKLSDRAISKAVSLAKETGMKITFFHARRDVDASLYGEAALLHALDPALLQRSRDKEMNEILKRAEAQAISNGVSSRSASIVSDEPYAAIIAVAEEHECDLILMASHGRRGMKGLLLGSQTQKVLTHSRIPVLVYR